MKNKLKILLLMLMPAILVVCSAIVFTACKDCNHVWDEWKQSGNKHVRVCTECGKKDSHKAEYTDWGRSKTEHWKVCAFESCGLEDSSSYEDHDTDSKCPDCGANFNVLAFGFTSIDGDPAHADFAKEANIKFAEWGEEYIFNYEYCASPNGHSDFSKLNDDDLANCDLVIFLNDSPGQGEQMEVFQKYMEAFQKYMEDGGAWLGFHASAFSMRAEGAPLNWYQDEFLACGDYKNNTWNPTDEDLHIETHDHFSTAGFEGETFHSAPCEWYGWMNDLRENNDIQVLLTLAEGTFPVGDSPEKEWEIWRDYIYAPIAWTNLNYNMIYTNMGHYLKIYNHYRKESSTFESEAQSKFLLNCILGLGIGW